MAMEGLHAITLVFLLATMLPMCSSVRSNPNYNPSSHTHATNNSTGRFGFSLPIYHRHHPKVESFFRSLEPQWVSPIHTESEYKELVYYADFNLGDRDTPTMAVLDTGSYITWLGRRPGFNPKGSRTYLPVECSTSVCNEVPDSNCTRMAGTSQCHFNLRYLDRTTMSGDVGIDYISVFRATYGGYTKIHPLRTQMVFGTGTRGTNMYPGILGVSTHPLGFLWALSVSSFSVCFPWDSMQKSYVRFGPDAKHFGPTTPLLDEGWKPAFRVESVWANDHHLTKLSSRAKSGGVFILDTGAAMTHLEPVAYEGVLRLVRSAIGGTPTSYRRLGYELCYMPRDRQAVRNLMFSFELDGGAPLHFTFQNMWVSLTDRWCLAFRRTNARWSILGIKQMKGWNFGFDYTDHKLFVAKDNICI